MRLLIAAAALLGCAPAIAPRHLDALAAGDRSLHSGRSVEAAAQYREASANADRVRDRDEADFREAIALRRAGDRVGAIARFEIIAGRSPDFERGARAEFEAALLRLDDDATREEGVRGLDSLVRRRPATGPAQRALAHLLRLDDARGTEASLARISALIEAPGVRETNLRETLLTERARRLLRDGRRAEAVSVWRSLFVEIGYPQNSRWDDAHIDLANALRGGADPRGAVAALDEMLAARDPACSGGSCDAPLFQEGAMLRGEILRDDLRDLPGAARAFHQTYEMFDSSTLRDDALWEEARVRERLADGTACAVWIRLAQEFRCGRRGRQAVGPASACGAPSATTERGCR